MPPRWSVRFLVLALVWVGSWLLVTGTAAHAAGHETGAAERDHGFRLYYSKYAGRLDQVRQRVGDMAQARGLPLTEYDIADVQVFKVLLDMERERGVQRYADIELFAGVRYLAGHREILSFLDALEAGTESLDKPPEPPRAPARTGMGSNSQGQDGPRPVGAEGASPTAGPSSTGSYRSVSALVPVPAAAAADGAQAAQAEPRRSWTAPQVAVFVAGVVLFLLGLAGALSNRRRVA